VSKGRHTIAKHQKLLSLPSRNLAQEGKKVEGYAGRILAHDSTRVGAAWVEVSQQSTVPRLKRLSCLLCVVALRFNEVSDDQLDRALCAAVWVCGANRAMLRNGDHVWDSSGIAIDCRR
jgi:hypothetical protein